MSLDAIYDVITEALPTYTVLQAGQSVDVGDDPLITFDELDSDNTHGVDVSRGTPVDSYFDLTQWAPVPCTIQLDAYSVTGRADLESLILFLRSEAGRCVLQPGGFGYVDAGAIRSLRFLQDTERLPRYSVDVRFTREMSRVDSVPTIDTLRVSGDFSGVESEIDVDLSE